MSKNAAPEEKLGQLHSVIADTLLEQLEGVPVFNDEGEEIARHVDPRIISSAITFLNNNKVTANPFISETVSDIEKKLAERTRRMNETKQRAKEAAEKYAQSI
jgi:hypothetical protein